MNEVARDVMDPRTGKPVLEEARGRQVSGCARGRARGAREGRHLWLSPLGSGSDYTPFLQHLTLASLNVGFGGESNGGIYHSMYDTVNWYTKFSDGDFAYGRDAVAAHRARCCCGSPTRRCCRSSSPTRPIRSCATSRSSKRWHGRARTRSWTSVRYGKPSKPSAARRRLREAYDAFDRASSSAFDARAELKELNKLLLQSERKLGDDDGLPRRDWFKHQIYAPGFYTGYGVKTMPQIREGLEENRLDEARAGCARSPRP